MPLYSPMGIPLAPQDAIIIDPMGSYTGIPVDRADDPVQDADDL